MSQVLILICLVALVSAFVQAATGFGMSIIVMAFWPLFLPVADCTILLLITSGFSIVTMAIKGIKHTNFRLILLPSVFSIAGFLAGFFTLISFDNSLMVKILGGILVAFSFYLFFFSEKLRIPNTRLSASVAGAFSGILAGLVNIPGPPMVLYYSVATEDKHEYMGTIQTFFAIHLVVKIIIYFAVRGISPVVVSYLPFTVISALAGMILGMYVFKSLPAGSLKRLIYIIMAAAGGWYLFN